MKKNRNLLWGISVLPALLVMPAMGTTVHVILENGYDDTLVIDGHTSDWGAYIAQDSIVKLKSGSAITSNNASFGGGIISFGNLTATGAVFSGNEVVSSGGAIYSSGTALLSGMTFGGVGVGNKAANGGAIANFGTMTVAGTFNSNEATNWGGAIYNAGDLTIANNTSFVNNKALSVGGAITNALGTSVLKLGKNVSFVGNEAVADGGAIGNYKGAILVDGTTFISNKAQTGETDQNAIGGGAMSLGAESTTSIANATFTSNVSGFNGGALGTRHSFSADNSAAALDVNKSVFTRNKATGTVSSTFSHGEAFGGNGGALDNHFYNSETKAGFVYVGNSKFVSNEAVNGGAIYNNGTEDQAGNIAKLYLENSEFTSNSATGDGGAIYNAGTFVMAGINSFSGNTANGVANDIFNTGSLNIASGTTTIDGGIDGTGTLTIADGAILNIGTASVTQNNITLNGTMLATLRSGDDAQIDVATFDDESTGSLNLAIRNEGTYHVFGTDVFGNVNMESSLYDLVRSADNKDVVATMKSVADIASDNNLTAETAVAVSGLASSSSEKLNDLAMVIQEKLATKTDETRTEVEHAKAAIHPETESVVQSVSSSVQSTVTSLAMNRMALPTVGRSGGDVKMTSGGVWVNGIFNKTKQNDSFNGYTRGFAAGLDGTINKVWTIGAGYAFAHSDIAGTARDTEIDSSSVFVYGQYKPGAWYVNAVANYTMSDYTEKGAVFGVGIAADYDVDSFGANIATGYDFAGGITPELGLRYMHINSSDYISSLDIKNELADADYLTASLETKYAFDIKASKRLNLRPELHYAVKYDLLSDAQVATVTMPGVNAYSLNGERLSRVGGEFGIGMGIVYRGAGISLNYDIEAREDYTSQTGRVKFRYNF